MASLSAITRAEAVGLGIQQVFGVTPSYDYQADRVRIYFDAANLSLMRQRVNEIVSPKPGAQEGDVVIDWFPAVYPTAAKYVIPAAAGLFLAGYLLGKR